MIEKHGVVEGEGDASKQPSKNDVKEALDGSKGQHEKAGDDTLSKAADAAADQARKGK
jgi:hypothetical protein